MYVIILYVNAVFDGQDLVHCKLQKEKKNKQNKTKQKHGK